MCFITSVEVVNAPEGNDFARSIGGLVTIPSWFLSTVPFFGSVAIVCQRWGSGFGSVAYNISDVHGCIPFGELAYLEHGARSHAFRIVQTTQLVWAFVVCVLIMTSHSDGGNTDVSKEIFIFTTATILISFPLLLFEIVIATRGRPVVISGNCMLVELDPKFGFWDSEIDNLWKGLVGAGGL